METNDMNIPPANAVSIYGQSDAMDDFPVLKAFQQYVDAEQAKAHKRLMTLCVFFTIVMTIVIAVFLVIIFTLNRGKTGNDELVRLMMDQSRRQSEQLLDLATRGSAPSAPTPVDPVFQKEYLAAKAEAEAMRLAKEQAEREAAEAKAAPKLTMTEKEQLAKENELKKREAALKAREKRVAETAKAQAATEKRQKEKDKALYHRDRKLKEAEENAKLAERQIIAEKESLRKLTSVDDLDDKPFEKIDDNPDDLDLSDFDIPLE